ncbi:signal recognition particle protein [Calorimonas adulescens]|uniref:Signal recognition particle protein n=1 Tax=Calorimonas adulescens TaxID=2606906 RepID=A0A5D8QG48_9THEO|nr:signal recognition particle protein [Calorimonas adulescens]TZE83377.1 signal recognition particle protein [Calorimonas adulescens]
MAFESLASKLQETFKKLRSKGKLTEKDVKEAMKDVKIALLEADVNYKVVKDFINKVNEKAVGQEVLESLTPGQQVIKIVHNELVELMGKTNTHINFASKPPTVIMFVGLQGSGKTTTCGKLAANIKKQGKRPLLVAADVYRPAAIKQLQVLGQNLDVPVFTMGNNINPVDICKNSINEAGRIGSDVIIIDTAGRLHIDDEMMNELKEIKEAVKPHEVLLVVDAMTGQDAVNVAQNFNEQIGIDGLILTKLDGDTRGGAALSIRAVTGKPIKFVGTGEKMDALEPFHPDRLASRILGMGDVLSLIEKAQENYDIKKAEELQEKLLKQQFTLEDFLDQLQQIKRMGPLSQLVEMIPGLSPKQLAGVNINDRDVSKIEAIINSMTKAERKDPSIINGSRRKRIAMGSGTSIQDVNRLLKEFSETKKMMKMFGSADSIKKGKLKLPFMH